MRWLRYAGNCAVISAALWASRYVKCRVMITITEGGALRQHATHVNTGRRQSYQQRVGRRFVLASTDRMMVSFGLEEEKEESFLSDDSWHPVDVVAWT